MKSDSERPIMALKEAVRIFKQAKGGEVPIEEGPKSESQSNGASEKMIQEIAGQIVTLKDALETNLGRRLDTDDVMMLYIVQHAGAVITRCRIGHDGMTPYQRLRGKKAVTRMVRLGEKVLYMPLRDSREKMHKLESRFHYGIWAGISAKNGEYILLMPQGHVRASTIRGIIEAQRWDDEFVKQCGT